MVSSEPTTICCGTGNSIRGSKFEVRSSKLNLTQTDVTQVELVQLNVLNLGPRTSNIERYVNLMCGIAGFSWKDEELIARMTDALAHRGPDQFGVYTEDGVSFGHRRLSIIDLSENGRQPMSNEDGSIWVTFNGEIYNYRALRTELVAAGHRFRSRTDTEVIVHLYEECGIDCLERLRGMFAFAIWDRNHHMLFAARDRFGQKPFYYTVRGQRFLFASEIKGLLACTEIPVEPDPAAIDYYLTQRFVPPPLTMIRGIHKLPAGHWLKWHKGSLRIESYWQPRFTASPPRRDSDWIGELAERVDEAVRTHMISDVPVGALLSGGLDSSVVVACMARHMESPVQTFCVGSDERKFDERKFARRVAAHCQTLHRERCMAGEPLRSIPQLVQCLDEPSDPIAACMFEASRLASEHVKVALSGDGGDEIFAGFDRYAVFGWVERYASLPRWVREDVIRPVIQRIPESFGYKSLTQRLHWLDAIGGETGGRLYARMTSVFRFGPKEKSWAYGPILLDQLKTADAEAAIARPFEMASASNPLDRMLYTDMLTRLPEHTLMLTDRLSMAHGLEMRSPLLDHELAEFCLAMPAHLKIRGGVTKFAMRQAADAWLPPDIVRRSKQGFMFPVAYWLNAETLELIRECLVHGPLVTEGWIERLGIERLLAEHKQHRADHHVRIWMLMNLDAWFRIYVQGEAIKQPAEPYLASTEMTL
jgi:asparagine synthase (glutamine-hydrolysing)